MVQKIKFSKDGKFVIASDFNRKIYIWDTVEEKKNVIELDEDQTIREFDVSMDSKHIVTATTDSLWLCKLGSDKKAEIKKVDIGECKFTTSSLVIFSFDGNYF